MCWPCRCILRLVLQSAACRSYRIRIHGQGLMGMQEERQSFKEKLTGSGLVDVWRQQYPDKVCGLRPSYLFDF